MPGALSLIDKLAELGIPLAIATSSSERMVAVKRRAQPAVFDKVKVIVCGDDAEVTNGKPSPDIFIVAGKKLILLILILLPYLRSLL